MILKKYYGSSINEAVRNAKEQLGEDIILLESIPASEERRAAVTVMMDRKMEKASASQTGGGELSKKLYSRADVKPSKPTETLDDEPQDSTDAEDTNPNGSEEDAASSGPRQSLKSLDLTEDSAAEPMEKPARGPESQPEPPEESAGTEFSETEDPSPAEEPISRHHGALMDTLEQQRTEQTEASEEETSTARESGVSREVAALHKRMDQLEAMMNESLISANLEYASHPAFQQLMEAGVSATTISGWFSSILNEGVDPYEDSETFMFQLAKIVRDALTITLPEPVQKNLMFAGASGSGKTSLIMKLAANDEFMGDKQVALVSVEPRNSVQRYTILEPFASDHEIPFHRVRDGIDASKLSKKLEDYDHVLFDTPSISVEKKTAFREYWKIRQILASISPIEIHFVVDATMQNYYFRESYATNHPLQPDYVAITHLDETRRWGHIIPFLKTLGCSVRYMSMGPAVPDDINAFSPTWFAEKILSQQ